MDGKTMSEDNPDLSTGKAIAAYLTAALESYDPSLVAAALGKVARAHGVSRLSRETGIAREVLYRALSPGVNPHFGTVLKVLEAFGMRLRAAPARRR